MTEEFTSTEIDPETIELLLRYKPELYQPGDLTCNDAMELWGIRRQNATIRLADMVRDGVLVEIKNVMLPSQRLGRVWRRVAK